MRSASSWDDPSGVAQSKLGPEFEDYLVRIDGLTIVRQDRKVGSGRVTLYARSTLKVKILRKSNTTGTENGETGECKGPKYLMRLVQQGDSSPVFVAVVYRLPNVILHAYKLDGTSVPVGES